MNPNIHAKNAARKYGGVPSDYLPYEIFMDQCREHLGDIRHRLITHNTWFIVIAELALGPEIKLSNGCTVRTMTVLEDHVREDMGGRLPTLEENFRSIKPEDITRESGVFDAILRTAMKEEV